jgi:hypothetical protein
VTEIEMGPAVRFPSGATTHASTVFSRWRKVYMPLCRNAPSAGVAAVKSEVDCPLCLQQIRTLSVLPL